MKKYEKFVKETSIEFKNVNEDLIFFIMGIAGESGEILDRLIKHLRGGFDNSITDELREDLIEELGDILFYITRSSQLLGISLDEVMQLNIEKLLKRIANKNLLPTTKRINK